GRGGAWGVGRPRARGWLVAESFGLAGDLAGTLALLVDTERNGHSAPGKTPPLSRLIEDRLLPLRDAPEEQKRRAVIELWDALDRREIFLLDKLLTGELRVGVSGT